MVTTNDFYDCKHMKNEEMHRKFTEKFHNMVCKFESLSKSNAYKKIQKTNFLKIEHNEDKILNLLNKLTNQNYETIEQKILLKTTSNNAVEYVNQILQYVSKSTVSPKYLWLLIKTIFNIKEMSKTSREIIVVQLKSYISNFVKLFETTRIDSLEVKEDYLGFLERNQENTTIFSKIKMISEILNDQSDKIYLNFDVNILFNILIDRLHQMISNSKDDNSIFVLLECIHIIIPSEQIKNNPYAYKRFLNCFSNETTQKNLKNKLRFKLYDIIDYLKQNECKRVDGK